ncbi:MAG: TIGR01777 family oxidoreductase [Acidimicrobiales bacterium]
MRVAVTGSTGLIGTALVTALRGEAHDVVRVVRGEMGPTDEATIRWDPAHGAIDEAGLEGVDAVVHLAGANIGGRRWNDAYRREILESRTRGTALISEAVAGLTRRPAVLISASGINYYPDGGDEKLTEASGPGHSFLSELCKKWEAATAFADAAGVRVVRIRTAPVIAGHDGFLPRMRRLFQFGLGGRLGSGRQWMSWIALDDEVAAIRFLLDATVSGPVNLASPHPVTNREFTKTLARVLRRPAFVPVPAFGPRLVLGREMADELLFTSLRVEPAALTEAGYQFRYPELEPALRATLGR